MQAYVLSLHTPSTPGWGQKVNFFLLKIVMLLIKLKGMEYKAPCNTYTVLTHTIGPCGGVKRSELFFLNVVMLHIKLKGKKHRPT